jgi:hypothetical protein
LLAPVPARRHQVFERHDEDPVDLGGVRLEHRRGLGDGDEGEHRHETSGGEHYRELSEHLDDAVGEGHLFSGLAQSRREG